MRTRVPGFELRGLRDPGSGRAIRNVRKGGSPPAGQASRVRLKLSRAGLQKQVQWSQIVN